MRETDTFHCFWAVKENTKIERKPNSASYISFSRFFYSCVTSAVSVEIRFFLVSKPSEDNTKPAVCSKKVCSVKVCAEFSALKFLSFKTMLCSPSEVVGMSAWPLGDVGRGISCSRIICGVVVTLSVSLGPSRLQCQTSDVNVSCFCLMFTPPSYVFFCMFSWLDCNREEENEVSKTDSFLDVAPETCISPTWLVWPI